MLTLAAADSIGAVASSAATINCTIYGMELTAATSAEVYKTLYQGQLSNVAAAVYTVGTGLTAFVKTIKLVNTDAANARTFQLFSGGVAAGNGVTPVFTLPAGGAAVYEDGQGWQFINSSGQVLGLGATGATGATGPQGAIGMGSDGEPGEPGMAFGYTVPRDAVFLGIVTAAAVTVGPLKWTDTYRRIIGGYVIGGYNGGTPVGRLLCGAASISTTGATNGNALFEDTTKNTTSVSVPGCPLAVTLSAIARSGQFTIDGASGALKRIDILGDEGTPAVASSPVTFRATSWFSDLSTNLPIQQLQLSVYDTLITTALSAQTFTATTSLWAWGIR